MNNNKNYEHRTTNNTDIHKTTQIYTRQHRYTQDNKDIYIYIYIHDISRLRVNVMNCGQYSDVIRLIAFLPSWL
jgi:hypothetical protein